ncbi:MAG: HPr-rel-A system PqqD family peptide chaperone [Pseudomonadales bacterium]|nr:HPr-rel-A system PqqD family peptide chaperone [Pseudomonadales bacterium]
MFWKKSQQFQWGQRQWSNGALLYNQSSGDTHYLDHVSMLIVSLLEDAPLDITNIQSELAEQSAEIIELPNNHFALQTMVANLQRIGLIEVSS